MGDGKAARLKATSELTVDVRHLGSTAVVSQSVWELRIQRLAHLSRDIYPPRFHLRGHGKGKIEAATCYYVPCRAAPSPSSCAMRRCCLSSQAEDELRS